MSAHPIPAAVLSQHIAVLGKTGSGKTSTEKLIVEQVVAEGFRVCVLDTQKSDWWGITSSASGKSAGLPFKILGGPRGHVPLHSSAGKPIGQLVGSGKLPLSIIDMADFEAGGVQRFFVDFAQALFRSARGVVYLVVEEAHELAPKERAGFGAENMAIHWAKKLATGSRSKGIRLILATQRVQSLHNAMLGSCESLIVHRLTTPADQEPVIKWLKANATTAQMDEAMASLSSLPTGTGWVCSGEAKIFEQIKFPKFKTYDNTATPTGDEAAAEVKVAPVDRDELRAIIGDAVKEAEANDAPTLRRALAERDGKIRALEQQITAAKAAAPAIDPATIADAEKRGFEQRRAKLDAEAKRAALAAFAVLLGDLTAESASLLSAIKLFAGRLRLAKNTRLEIAPVTFAPPKPSSFPKPAAQLKPGAGNGAGDASLGKGEKIMLTAIAQYPDGATREQLTVLTGYKKSSRDTYIQRLAAAGLVDVAGAAVRATQVGVDALGADFAPLPTGEALQAYWLHRLTGGEQRILAHLIGAYPNAIERNALDEPCGYKKSARDTYIQRLAARKLITGDRGQVRAADMLFEAA